MLHGFSPNYDYQKQREMLLRMSVDEFVAAWESGGRFIPFKDHGFVLTTREVEVAKRWRKVKRLTWFFARLPWLMFKRWMRWN